MRKNFRWLSSLVLTLCLAAGCKRAVPPAESLDRTSEPPVELVPGPLIAPPTTLPWPRGGEESAGVKVVMGDLIVHMPAAMTVQQVTAGVGRQPQRIGLVLADRAGGVLSVSLAPREHAYPLPESMAMASIRSFSPAEVDAFRTMDDLAFAEHIVRQLATNDVPARLRAGFQWLVGDFAWSRRYESAELVAFVGFGSVRRDTRPTLVHVYSRTSRRLVCEVFIALERHSPPTVPIESAVEEVLRGMKKKEKD